jgi:hypothetical protein
MRLLERLIAPLLLTALTACAGAGIEPTPAATAGDAQEPDRRQSAEPDADRPAVDGAVVDGTVVDQAVVERGGVDRAPSPDLAADGRVVADQRMDSGARWRFFEDFSAHAPQALAVSNRLTFTWVTEETAGSNVSVVAEGAERMIRFTAAGRGDMATLGKAAVSKDYGVPVGIGDVVVSAADFFLAEYPVDGSLFLIDVECRQCEDSTKPGFRIKVTNRGTLNVNYKLPNRGEDGTAVMVPRGRWFRLELRARLGRETGLTEVFIDGVNAYRSTGWNVTTHGLMHYSEFGATANSGTALRTVLVDRMEIRIE